jgi:hypothetical protein
VDEYFGELGACHHWIQYEWESTRLGEAGPLILSRERDRDFRPPQEPWCGWFDCHDLPEGELLGSFGGEARIAVEYDVDHLGHIMVFVTIQVVFILLLLPLLLVVLIEGLGSKRPVEVVALLCGVLGFRGATGIACGGARQIAIWCW